MYALGSSKVNEVVILVSENLCFVEGLNEVFIQIQEYLGKLKLGDILSSFI